MPAQVPRRDTTPPHAMVMPDSSLLSSSSLRAASWMWRGTMRVRLLSLRLLSRAALQARLQGLSRQVLEDSREVHGGTSTHTGYDQSQTAPK